MIDDGDHDHNDYNNDDEDVNHDDNLTRFD